jgi:propanediol dehydratase small subunit
MDYRATANLKTVKANTLAPSRIEMANELRRQADVLRDNGKTAAEFWLADQYEKTANLLN